MGGRVADRRKWPATAARRPIPQAAAPCGLRLPFFAPGSQRGKEQCVIATVRGSSLLLPEPRAVEMALICKVNRNLTEFSIRPMLSPRLKEVHVNEAAKNLTIAVLTTIVDAAVVVWFGGVIWRALSPIIWSRILTLLLAALWALSLARIWACAIYSLRGGRRSRSLGLTSGTAITSIDLRGEGDV